MSANRILIVDDEPTILELYRIQLADDFELETASSGAEGIEKLKESGPYAVVVPAKLLTHWGQPLSNGGK